MPRKFEAHSENHLKSMPPIYHGSAIFATNFVHLKSRFWFYSQLVLTGTEVWVSSMCDFIFKQTKIMENLVFVIFWFPLYCKCFLH